MIRSSFECLTNENLYGQQCGLMNNSSSVRPYPWIASITCNFKMDDGTINKLGHICGGTLISSRHLLTAAHCLKLPNKYLDKKYILNKLNPTLESTLKVAINLSTLNNEPTYYSIKKIYIHEAFDSKTLANDLALIELEQELDFNSYVQPVCLPDQEIQGYPTIGSDSYLISWFRNAGTQNQINKIDMSVVSEEYCLKYGNQEIQICAKALRTNSACRGDSGGPLIIQNRYCGNNRMCNVLAGITSYILGKNANPYECNSLYPTFFTRVSSYTAWIKMKMFISYANY